MVMDKYNSRIDLLVIEDSRGDFALAEEYLYEEFKHPAITHVQTFNETRKILQDKQKGKFDCILLDLSLPDKSGEDLLDEIFKIVGHTPVVILTGYSDLSFSVKSFSKGVSDYLLKDELSPMILRKSIVYSIERNDFSEKKYKDLFESSPKPMWLYDVDSMDFLDVNKAAVSHYGYSRDEFLSMKVNDIQSDKSPDIEIEDLMNGHKSSLHSSYIQGINSHIKKSGEIISVELEANIIKYQERDARLVVANDVTEKQKDQEKLKLFESVITNTNDSVIITEAEASGLRKIQFVNDAFTKMTGYTRDEILGKPTDILFGDDTDTEKVDQLEKEMQHWELYHGEMEDWNFDDQEIILYKKDGSQIWVNTSIIPLVDKQNSNIFWVMVSRDITETKKKEQNLKESLSEKEVLLSEIHHRVKNNMALVSGMLQMQVFEETDENIINKLNNSMLRVQTMSTIHQLLYESNSFSELEFSKIVNKLIEATHKSFSVNKDIHIENNTESFDINIDQAIPCSLIVNEVITNIYKHAFKGRTTGTITTELRKTEDDVVILKIADDGVGLPEGFDMDNLSSLGTTIISALVKQLHGTFRLKPNEGGGTLFELEFDASEDNEIEESIL